jgi:DNA-binding NtrC family response regulator
MEIWTGYFWSRSPIFLDPEMKVIMMTGSPQFHTKVTPLCYRLDALLEKPFRLDEFKDLITRIMGESDWKRRGESETAKPSSAAKILTPA